MSKATREEVRQQLKVENLQQLTRDGDSMLQEDGPAGLGPVCSVLQGGRAPPPLPPLPLLLLLLLLLLLSPPQV